MATASPTLNSSSSVRVSSIPLQITEKQLKVYFSNPNNGGGRITQIFYPLPGNDAVIVYENSAVMDKLMKCDHQLNGVKVRLNPSPGQLYRRVMVELDHNLADILNAKPDILEEIQYSHEEMEVNFDYDKETYVLHGTWHQLEWTLHFLDTLLNGSQRNIKDSSQSILKKNVTFKDSGVPIETMNFYKKKPATPTSTSTSDDHKISLESAGQLPGKKQTAVDSDEEMAPTFTNKLDDEEEEEMESDKDDESKSEDDSGSETDEDNYDANSQGSYGNSLLDHFSRQFFGSGSNPTNPSPFAGYGRGRGHPGSSMRVPPLRPPSPPKTSGIDVAHTDFGDLPLTYDFTVSQDFNVKVVMDDITKQQTDAIVNSAYPDLGSQYGISRVIAHAAGHKMVAECQKYVKDHGKLNASEVVHTSAGGNLHRRVVSIIHAVGPVWKESRGQECTHLLVCTYLNCLQHANTKLWARTMATPLISAGNYGFPLDVCIQAFFDSLMLFDSDDDRSHHLQEVSLVVNDPDSTMAAIVILRSLLDAGIDQLKLAAIERYELGVVKYNVKAIDFQPVRRDVEKTQKGSEVDKEDEEEEGEEEEEENEVEEEEENEVEEEDVQEATDEKVKEEKEENENIEDFEEEDVLKPWAKASNKIITEPEDSDFNKDEDMLDTGKDFLERDIGNKQSINVERKESGMEESYEESEDPLGDEILMQNITRETQMKKEEYIQSEAVAIDVKEPLRKTDTNDMKEEEEEEERNALDMSTDIMTGDKRKDEIEKGPLGMEGVAKTQLTQQKEHDAGSEQLDMDDRQQDESTDDGQQDESTDDRQQDESTDEHPEKERRKES